MVRLVSFGQLGHILLTFLKAPVSTRYDDGTHTPPFISKENY